MAVYMGTAAPLIAGRLRVLSDKDNLILLRQRQYTLVFQKNNRLLRHLSRHLVVFVPVKHRVLIPVFLIAENNIQNTGTGKRGRPPKVETNDNVERVNRTFTVDLALWQDLQHLARIFNKPVSEYLEELMRAAVKKNAAILDSVKQLKN